jgi:hypothetical protein
MIQATSESSAGSTTTGTDTSQKKELKTLKIFAVKTLDSQEFFTEIPSENTKMEAERKLALFFL